jgi:hypothetical protein
LRMRARLFRVLFMKIAVIYAIAIPITIRKAIEWSILLIAFLSLFVLCHLHVTFIRTPINCLDHVQNDWPRDGILRVQILNDPHDNNQQIVNNNNQSNQKQENSSVDFDLNNINEDIVVVERNGVEEEVLYDVNNNNMIKSNDFVNNDENKDKELSDYYYSNLSSFDVKDLIDYSNQINNNNENNGYPQPLKEKVSHLQMIARAVWPHESYIVEYSLEYGFLRLSARSRQRLQIPIKVVTLDPNNNECFGDLFSRTLLDNFLGYDDILMGSLKNLAEKENNKGYVRNVITGEHYRFVNIWMTRASYIAAAVIILVLTLSI